MPDNPPAPPPTRAQTVARTVNRHMEAALLGIGFLLGGLVAIVAGLLT